MCEERADEGRVRLLWTTDGVADADYALGDTPSAQMDLSHCPASECATHPDTDNVALAWRAGDALWRDACRLSPAVTADAATLTELHSESPAVVGTRLTQG